MTEQPTFKKIPDRETRLGIILDTLEGARTSDYIGESVSQVEHALQCAAFAESLGHEEEVIIASLLHDMGHYCYRHPTPSMEGLGVCDHEWLGARKVLELGLSPNIAELIGLHVNAKRYLTAKKPAYHARLSSASQQTLNFQGGIMNLKEMQQFEKHPLFKKALQVRANDERAKIKDFKTEDIEHYRPLIEKHLLLQEQKRIPVQDKHFCFVRHAEAEGQAPEAPLTPAGRESLKALTASLEQFNPDMIISSPFTRARQTAEAIAKQNGQRVYIDHRLAEQEFGFLPGDRLPLIRGVIDDIQKSVLNRYVIATHGGWLTCMIEQLFPDADFAGLSQLKRPHVIELIIKPETSQLIIHP